MSRRMEIDPVEATIYVSSTISKIFLAAFRGFRREIAKHDSAAELFDSRGARSIRKPARRGAAFRLGRSASLSAAHCHEEAPRPKQQLTTVMNAHRIPGNLERDCKKQSKRRLRARSSRSSLLYLSLPPFPPPSTPSSYLALERVSQSTPEVEATTTTFVTASVRQENRRKEGDARAKEEIGDGAEERRRDK